MTELERILDSLRIAAWEFIFGSGNEALRQRVAELRARYDELVAAEGRAA